MRFCRDVPVFVEVGEAGIAVECYAASAFVFNSLGVSLGGRHGRDELPCRLHVSQKRLSCGDVLRRPRGRCGSAAEQPQ